MGTPDSSRAAFRRLFAADAVVRVGYQVGKAPVLPVFAATVGATDLLLGAIVSVSVVTGMLIKPAVGRVFDRGHRRSLLLIGTLIFVVAPFAYLWVGRPAELVGVRLLHGCATAIYGPVTVAWIAGLARTRVAERLGWFGVARAAGYVLGPLAGGWLLTVLPPRQIYPLIGCLSAVALWPALRMRGEAPCARRPSRSGWVAVARNSALWRSGLVDCALQIALYAIKTFLPVFALRAGTSLLAVGGLLAIQELTHLLARPAGGRVADRLGRIRTIVAGGGLVAGSLIALGCVSGAVAVTAAFVCLGLGQALMTPALLAWVADAVPAQSGAALGLAGALQNMGKVLGPIVGGALLLVVDFREALMILASLFGLVSLLAGAFGRLGEHPADRG